jgi:filamentous hemagglutinin
LIFFDPESGTATSAKTLDTTLQSRLTNPQRVYTSVKRNVDAILSYDKPYALLDRLLDPADILKRELQLAVPSGTTPAQWEQISRAIQYGENQGVKVVVATVKGPVQ